MEEAILARSHVIEALEKNLVCKQLLPSKAVMPGYMLHFRTLLFLREEQQSASKRGEKTNINKLAAKKQLGKFEFTYTLTTSKRT